MMAEKKISNYEKMKNDMADVFLKYDQEEMIRKFSFDYLQHILSECIWRYPLLRIVKDNWHNRKAVEEHCVPPGMDSVCCWNSYRTSGRLADRQSADSGDYEYADSGRDLLFCKSPDLYRFSNLCLVYRMAQLQKTLSDGCKSLSCGGHRHDRKTAKAHAPV